MNILYICADRGIPIHGHKGASVHVRALSDAFARAGHAVTIVSPCPGPLDGPAPLANIVHVPLPPCEEGMTSQVAARDRQAQAYNDVLYTAVLNLWQQGAYHMIYERYSLWSDAGARLTHETRLPFVLEVNAPLLEEAARYRSLSDCSVASQIEERQFKAACAISVVSEPLWEYVVQRGALPRAVHILPNGVDPSQFHPAVRGGRVRGRYGLHGRIVTGFCGRARPWHDLDTLLEAVAQLRAIDSRYHLLLVGQMPDDLRGRLARYGLTQATTITGPVPHHEVPSHLAAMDVAISSHLLLPRFYFSPLKLFEYLACGVPTVAADVGQPAHIIQNGETGYLYRPGDASSLVEQVLKLVENPAHARQIAWQGAVKVLGTYTWDKNAAAVASWVQPFLTGRVLRLSKRSKHAPHLPMIDPKLRQRLYRATRPDLAGPLMARRLAVFRKGGREQFEDISAIKVLKYKRGRRCVLGYEVNGRTRCGHRRTRYFIGKVFRDRRGLRLHQLQKVLWHNGFGFGAPDGIFVPEPLAYVPEMRMQVQAWAAGETLDELVTKREIKPLMPLVAKGLAKLHSLPVPLPLNGEGPLETPSYLLGDELENLENFTARLAEVRPQSMPEILPLREKLLAWAGQIPPLTAVAPIHRDFYYSQVLYNRDWLTLIDFDLFALGDPAIDVANFTAHLYLLGMEKLSGFHALAEEVALFLDSYARFGMVDGAFRQRLAFYQATTFYRLLRVVAPRPAMAHLFEPLLAHTALALESV